MARRGKFGRAALLLGAAAVAAGVLLKRDKITGLLSSGSPETADTGWAPAPATGPSNYDAPGPVANTATPIPAPEAEVLTEEGAIDEQAEESAAAAEAANIGGTVSDYAGPEEEGDVADEAERPLMESGEGSAEGLEQAEAELEAAAEEPLVGASDFGGSIDDAIEEAGRPFSGERLEAPSEPPAAEPELAEPEPEAEAAEPAQPEPEPEPEVTPAAPQSGWQPPAPPEPPTEVQEPAPPEEKKLPDDDDDDGDDWRTWSGQAIKP